jgi:hypothetical protein
MFALAVFDFSYLLKKPIKYSKQIKIFLYFNLIKVEVVVVRPVVVDS